VRKKQNVYVNGPFPEPGLVWYQHGSSDVIRNKREHPRIFLLTSKTKPCDGLFTGAHLFGKHINSTFVSVCIYIYIYQGQILLQITIYLPKAMAPFLALSSRAPPPAALESRKEN